MNLRKRILSLAFGFPLMFATWGCGSGSDPQDPETFQSNFQAAVQAAEKGKELMKSPTTPNRR